MRGSRWGSDQSDRPRRGRWSLAEVARLKELYGLKSNETIAKELGRPVSSVRRMAKTLFPSDPLAESKQARGPWTAEEIDNLKSFYGTRTDENIARIFGRSLEAITAKAAELCLAKDKAFVRKLAGSATTSMPRWSSEEIARLKDIYGTHSNLEIAQMLNRSVKSVVSKAHNLKLRKERERLAEMGRQNVSLRYGRLADGTKDPNIESTGRGDSGMAEAGDDGS